MTFSMSAVGASMASADELTSEQNQLVQLSGTNEPATPDVFTITAGNTSCKHVAYHIGTVVIPTTTLTATPTYSECTSLGFPATIHTNGCTFLFHITGGTLTTGDVEIKCLGGNEITVTAVSGGTTKCTIHVPPQTLSSVAEPDPVSYSIIGAGTTREVTALVNYKGLKYSHTAGSGLGSCPAGTGVNGTYVGRGVITANNDANTAHVGLLLSNI
jgi:hypothetical protein